MNSKSSSSVTPETMTQALKCIDDLKALLPFLLTAEEGERTGKQNMGQSGLAYGKIAVKNAKANTEILKKKFDENIFEQDVTFYESISTIEANLMSLMQSIDDSKVLIGQVIMKKANSVYEDIKIAAKDDNKYKPAEEELKEYYKHRNKKDPKVNKN